MLVGVIGKGFCHAALISRSNHPIVSVGDALIWAIISSSIGMALFLNQMAQPKLANLCRVGEEGLFSFLVSLSDAFSEEMILLTAMWLNLLNTFVEFFF